MGKKKSSVVPKKKSKLDEIPQTENKFYIDNQYMLIQAIDDSDVVLVASLIDDGADVNLAYKDNNLPIFYALGRYIDITVLKILLDNGADVTSINSEGLTPLKFLLSERTINLEALELIIEQLLNKHPEEKLPNNMQLIFDSLPQKKKIWGLTYPAFFLLLVEDGYDINAKDNNGLGYFAHVVSLHFGYEKNSLNEIIDLLKRGADINAEDDNGKSVFWMLLNDIVERDLYKGEDSSTLLEFYINCGANLNFVNSTNGKSILMQMVLLTHANHIKLLKGLLDQDIFLEVDRRDSIYNSVLKYALINPGNNLVIIEKLLQIKPLLVSDIKAIFLESLLDKIKKFDGIFYNKQMEIVLDKTFRENRNNKIMLLVKHGLVLDDSPDSEDENDDDTDTDTDTDSSNFSYSSDDTSDTSSDEGENISTNTIEKNYVEDSRHQYQKRYNKLGDLLITLVKKSFRDEYLPFIAFLLKHNLDVNYCDDCGISSLMYAANKNYRGFSITGKWKKQNYGIIKLLLNYGADYAKFFVIKRNNNKSFLSIINQRDKSQLAIWKIIQHIEYMKYHKEHFVLKSIKDINHNFTMHPDSLVVQLTSIKWQLQQKSSIEVYKELSQEKPTLLDYFGIRDGDSLAWKVEDQLKYIE